MRFDLGLIYELCCETELAARAVDGKEVMIDLGEGAILTFENAKGCVDECLAGFRDTPSHVHGNFEFLDEGGNYIELDYLELVSGLSDGRILICERHMNGRLSDRWLIHRDHNDEFKHMELNESIVVRRGCCLSLLLLFDTR